MKNYYITRDEDENIISLFARQQYKDQNFLAEDDQEIIDFFLAEQAIQNIEESRLAEIKAEKESTGLNKKITIQQAHNKIDQLFSGATTVALLRAACIRTFKILIVFILK